MMEEKGREAPDPKSTTSRVEANAPPSTNFAQQNQPAQSQKSATQQQQIETNKKGEKEDNKETEASPKSDGEQAHPFEPYRLIYQSLCAGLNLDEETRQSAWDLLARLTLKPQAEDTQYCNFMAACALYITGKKRLEKTNDTAPVSSNGVSLTQLLRATRIRLVDFFGPLKSFIANLKLGTVYEQQLQTLERKFVIISMLYRKYEKEFEHLFGYSVSKGSQTTNHKDTYLYQLFTFGWTLFLVAKGTLLATTPDLISAAHLLLCCLNQLLLHAPKQYQEKALRRVKQKLIPEGAGQKECTAAEAAISSLRRSNSNDMLQLLCSESGCKFSEVVLVEEQLFRPFLKKLEENNVLKLTSKEASATGETSEEMSPLAETMIKKCNQQLAREYEIMYHRVGDFDERLLLANDDQIGTPSRISTQYLRYYDYNASAKNTTKTTAPTTTGTPSSALPRPLQLNAPPSSPLPSAVPPGTPISNTLRNISWLQTTLMAREAQPSEILRRFFASCDTNPGDSVVDRAEKYAAKIQLSTVNEESVRRRSLALKLYYKILEAMLLAEEERLGHRNFTTLLNNAAFHRSLLACCMEILIYSYKLIDVGFPHILQAFEIEAFDFLKLIENVIRFEKKLPHPLVRHLSSIEEKILESIAWQSGSRIYPLLQDKDVQRDLVVYFQNRLTCATPVPPSPLLLSPARTPARPTPGHTPTKSRSGNSQSLQLFFRKLFQLVSLRCRNLCASLEITTELFMLICKALVQVLVAHSNLMLNRHIDQIILCVIYAVCRVNQQKDMAFRRILEKYRQHPQADPKIYRAVVLKDEEEKGDIITFYNTVFIPQLEPILLEFQAPSLSSSSSSSSLSSSSSSSSVSTSPSTNLPAAYLPVSAGFGAAGSRPTTMPSNFLSNNIGGRGTMALSPFCIPQSPVRLTPASIYLSPMRSSASASVSAASDSRGGSLLHSARRKLQLSGKRSDLGLASSSSASGVTDQFGKSSSLYSIGMSPSRDLIAINQAVNSPLSAPPKSMAIGPHGLSTSAAKKRKQVAPTRAKRLLFEAEEENEEDQDGTTACKSSRAEGNVDLFDEEDEASERLSSLSSSPLRGSQSPKGNKKQAATSTKRGRPLLSRRLSAPLPSSSGSGFGFGPRVGGVPLSSSLEKKLNELASAARDKLQSIVEAAEADDDASNSSSNSTTSDSDNDDRDSNNHNEDSETSSTSSTDTDNDDEEKGHRKRQRRPKRTRSQTTTTSKRANSNNNTPKRQTKRRRSSSSTQKTSKTKQKSGSGGSGNSSGSGGSKKRASRSVPASPRQSAAGRKRRSRPSPSASPNRPSSTKQQAVDPITPTKRQKT
ncbi:Retinoblastoma-like protein 1 [Balamuthia mandrillaris]